MDRDGRAEVFTVLTGIKRLVVTQGPGLPHVEDVSQAWFTWKRTEKFLDMNPKQEMGSDAVMALP